MNPEEMLTELSELINQRDYSLNRRWHIGILNFKLVCQPTKKEPPLDIVFGTYADSTLEKGFTGPQWDTLTVHISRFCLLGDITSHDNNDR